MLEVRCADLGIVCRGKVEGATEQELVRKVADHAARDHRVPTLNQTLVNYVLKKATGTAEGREVSA